MNLWTFAAFPALAALFAWLWWRSRVRERHVRALAATYGFHYLGAALPKSLDLSGCPLASVRSVWNVIDGEPHGTRIVSFDCTIGEGKSSWRRTVIAIKAQADSLTVSAFDISLRLEQVREWVFIYYPKDFALIPAGLMPLPELRAYLETIAT